jgi:hypothetical protein
MKKVKVKLSLRLPKHHAMKTYWGVEVQLYAFLTSALDGGEWSASRHSRFIPTERVPGTHWIGSWVSHFTHTDPYPSKTQHNITQYREKCLKRGDVGCTKPHAQCSSNIKGTALSSWYTSESSTDISNRSQVDKEKRNPYEHKSRTRRPEPTPASLLSSAYMSHLSRTVMAVSWLLHIGVRQIHSEE